MFTYSRMKPGQIRSQEWFSEVSLGLSAQDYVCYLADRGYAESTITGYLRSVAHFAHWLKQEDISLDQIGEEPVERFLNDHLPGCQCASKCWRARTEVRAALAHFLKLLRVNGMCLPRRSVSSVAIADELAVFSRHLVEVRGLAGSTCAVRLHHVRDFLIDQFGAKPIDIACLKPTDIERFVMSHTQGLMPSSIKSVSQSLRSYLLFKASQGMPSQALIAALPRVAQWRLAKLPDILSVDEIERLLSAFDRKTATGKRDYAITRCLVDLGLRRTEVAHLLLDDVDWRAGVFRIHGKGKRIDVLPLPQATGRAIVDYLRHGRPKTTRRELFVRHRPPTNAAANLDIVRNAVRYAAKRCQLQERIRGTHIFRYTIAARMVQAGTPFKEIADLLRHRSLDTTTIYAKVDLPSLRRVALPWPGRRP